ncbi:unnamed protein product [Symbiodinium sp. CCMP2456]|nr:unnamed protein product [Symbiodinium sp. CCMP2456]
MNLHSLALLLAPSSVAVTASTDTANVLTTFRHMQGWRCKTRMFSALHLPDHLEMVEKVQQASVWCSHHPGCYGVQFYNAGPEEDFMYCMKWCGQPQWCLAPLEEDAEGLQADELVQDNLFYLLVKPRPGSDSLASPLQGLPARCSYAGRVGPCFDPLAREACRAHKFKPGQRAFVFADDLQRRAEWMDHLEDSYILHLQRKWAEPNGVDVVLILPDDTTARYPISGAQRSALMRMGVRLLEVPWIRPELGKGIPSWAQQVWCVDRDFFKLHALGLEYDAIIFYDTDVFVNPPDFSHLEAVFNCAYQGYFLASALHGGFEPLTVAFFALRPSPALLRAVQRFLLNATFDDDGAWNWVGFGPWGCLDSTDEWCFRSYHVGGECGQGLFYDLFYRADQVFWTALEAEPSTVRPLGVMLDGCIWLYENSVRVAGFPTVPNPCPDMVAQHRCSDIVAYHKVIEGRGCAASPDLLGAGAARSLRLYPSDAADSLYNTHTSPTFQSEMEPETKTAVPGSAMRPPVTKLASDTHILSYTPSGCNVASREWGSGQSANSETQNL